MENMEKMDNINRMSKKNSVYDSKHPINDSKHSFCHKMTQNTLFYSIYRNCWKIMTYALGEHDQLIMGQLKIGEDQA